MEDAHVIHLGDGEGYFGILDGHGGADCSAWCSQRLHEKLAADGCPVSDAAAKDLVINTDAEFLATGLTGGSTAAMCVIRHPKSAGGKHKVHVINAGDSRVLLSRADGTIIDGGGTDGGLTVDHKPNDPVEKERIERCGGKVVCAAGGVYRVNGDLAVSRGFGDGEYKKTGGPSPEDRPVGDGHARARGPHIWQSRVPGGRRPPRGRGARVRPSGARLVAGDGQPANARACPPYLAGDGQPADGPLRVRRHRFRHAGLRRRQRGLV